MLGQCDDPLDNPHIHFEAEMIARATPEQIDAWSRWGEDAFCRLQAEYSARRLKEYGGKAKWIRDRNIEQGRRMNKAQREREESPCVNPRSLAVEPQFKAMAEAGRRGGYARHKKIVDSRMCVLFE